MTEKPCVRIVAIRSIILLEMTFILFIPAMIYASPQQAEGKPAIVKVTRIWDKAEHNAFTDLIRFEGMWYCTFRESDAHAQGRDGEIRIIVSNDGDHWKSAAVLTEDGVDLRDPKLSATSNGRLMLVMGGSVYEGRKLVTCQSRVAFSKDGMNWTPIQKVLTPGPWLWRVTWHQGHAYGVTYNSDVQGDWQLKLYRSRDGIKYTLITDLEVPGEANETTLRFLPDGRMIALVRREGTDTNAWIGTSVAPYTEWKWRRTNHQVGGPNFIVLPDGGMWAAGRSYPGGTKTVLARMSQSEYEPMLTLPSGGDTSYPGLVFSDGILWMSYYSSHEGKTSIYLAKIKLP